MDERPAMRSGGVGLSQCREPDWRAFNLERANALRERAWPDRSRAASTLVTAQAGDDLDRHDGVGPRCVVGIRDSRCAERRLWRARLGLQSGPGGDPGRYRWEQREPEESAEPHYRR